MKPSGKRNLASEPPDWQVPRDWWRDFFGPDYLLMYKGAFAPGVTAEQVRCIVRALELPRGARILDAGCGHGRHVKPLRNMGYDAVGVDFHPTQIAACRGALVKRKPLPVVRGDLRLLPLSSAFDAVISVYGSFGFFSDDENELHLAEMCRVLRPGGRLFLDVENPARSARDLAPERKAADPHKHILVLEEFHRDEQAHCVRGRKLLTAAGRRSEYFFSLRQYTREELENLFTANDLRTIAAHGDYDGQPLRNGSERLILVAEKG